jgi:hypothetical protein
MLLDREGASRWSTWLARGPLDPIIGTIIFDKIAHSPREHLHICTQQKPSTLVDFGIDPEE